EVVEADLNRPETLKAAFEGAHGVFLVTNFFQEKGADELKQATAAVRAAKDAGLIWSTLPNVEGISGGKFHVPHFTGKAKVDEIVETLNQQGHKLSVKQIPTEVFATFFPGAAEIAEMFNYFQAHTYLGSDSSDRIALATKIAGRQPTKFSTWARVNFPVQNA